MVPHSRDVKVITAEASGPIYGQEERIKPYTLMLSPHSLLLYSTVPEPREWHHPLSHLLSPHQFM